ncbi:MAG: HAD-IIIC family phosphatase, partial [Nakamurella sp.]
MTGPASEYGDLDEEFAAALADVSRTAVPELAACLRLAKANERHGDLVGAVQWAFAATDSTNDFAGWLGAARIVNRCRPLLPAAGRRARIAVLGSYTTSQLTSLLPVAAARIGLDVEIYESGYGQYRADVLNPDSELYSFGPDVVVLAVHEGEVALPTLSADPEQAVDAELARWTSLWELIGTRLQADIVQHSFAIPPEVSLGHLALRMPGSRYAMLQRLNERLGELAVGRVSLVDCERLAGIVGKYAWFDARYFHLAKQAVGLNAVPLLVRHTAAVLGARLGLGKKCLVLDLDNTLWGGVLGEVGPHGISLGSGPVGEAYTAFQRYIKGLKDKGVVLAVCSKNNDQDVQEVLREHPDMVLRAEEFALIAASWQDKPQAVRHIAETLGIGLDSVVFVDDNPAEREAVRQLLPEVDVVALPAEPAGYVQALSSYPFFESSVVTADDVARTGQYQARASMTKLLGSVDSMEEYLASLDMQASFSTLNQTNTARVAQLIGKTNQFNLTTKRRTSAEVEALADDPAYLSQVVRLRDRFADHGIVGVLLAALRHNEVEVDTWLLSCRVIGRGLEDEMMSKLIADAERAGCERILGTYRPTLKNSQVADLYPRLGFRPTEQRRSVGQQTDS